MSDNPALERLKAKALREVLLPTGLRLKVRVPSLAEMLRNEAMPESLREVALARATGKTAEADVDADAVRRFLDASDYLGATMIERVHSDAECDETQRCAVAEHWEPFTLAVEDIGSLDAYDRERLTDIAWHIQEPEQVTATTLEKQGQLSHAEAAARRQREAAATVDGWRDFRSEPGGADTRDAGEAVGAAAE